ncbi:MAG: 4-hydroxy-tetrahydrodipicolinate synthase [Lachnospiraceae bacterium]|nr:4-hydroxy-tetrahydrodipicolinate synthase [Lachnospiraceae bacterium]
MAIFEGAGVAIITPFHADGSVNYEKLDELLDYQINNGTDAIIICGTTGESATLSEEEHSAVIAHTVKYVNHRVPVIAGTGSNATYTAIQLSTAAEKDGADAILVVTPYYNKATQKGLYEHYKAVADAVSVPIIVYNVPSRTGCNILPATLAKLHKECKNIVAVKEASGNITQIADVAQMCGPDFCIYSGNDDQIVPILSLGGKGVISVLSNIAPKQTHDIVAKYLAGDLAGSLKMQLDAMPLIHALFCEVNPIPVKHAANLMGMEVGPLRAPLCEMEPANLERLKKEMVAYGLTLA